MPPKTQNHLLQQTAGTGRLIKGQCSSGPPPLMNEDVPRPKLRGKRGETTRDHS